MVAQASQEPPKSPLASAKPRRTGRGFAIPLHSRIHAQNLYLCKGLPYREISKETGLSIEQLERLAVREGWTKKRKAQKERLARQVNERTEAVETEILESVVSLAGQHSLRGLEKTGEALERTDRDAARDFQSYTSGVKNLVSIMRDIRAPQAEAQEGARLNVFVLRVGDQAKPAAAAAATESAPRIENTVTEVSATPVSEAK